MGRRSRFEFDESGVWAASERQQSRTLAAHLEDGVASTWTRGWQPADLVGAARRYLPVAHARLLAAAVVSQSRHYRYLAGAEERWLRQLKGLQAEQRFPVGDDVLAAWSRADQRPPNEALGIASALISWLRGLPTLPRLCVPPHEWGDRRLRCGAGRAASRGVDAKILARVRALLAKAESTLFVAEAEALTAKAQELMSRHAIEAAMLGADEGTETEGRRVGIEDPYAGPKATLLSVVAEANGCRAVSSPVFGFSTIFGFGSDLDVVELLFTSLLVQATQAMTAEGKDDRWRRRRAFRRSFLYGFAMRIGERLAEVAAVSVVEAGARHGAALVPVLAARAEAVDDACRRAFPEVTFTNVRVSDPDGWVAGIVTADGADLAAGPKVSRPATPLAPRAG